MAWCRQTTSRYQCRTSVYQDLQRHMASIGLNALTDISINIFCLVVGLYGHFLNFREMYFNMWIFKKESE